MGGKTKGNSSDEMREDQTTSFVQLDHLILESLASIGSPWVDVAGPPPPSAKHNRPTPLHESSSATHPSISV